MFLHKIIPDHDFLIKHKRKFAQDAYFIHEFVWQLVSRNSDQKRDFLYRVEYGSYQQVKAILLLNQMKLDSTDLCDIQVSPPYQPKITNGERLKFTLRANPVNKRRENGKLKEYGLIMDAKHQLAKQNKLCSHDYSLDELIHKKGIEWLNRKGNDHGFIVEQWQVKTQNDNAYTAEAKNKRPFIIRTLDFSGYLTVTDHISFENALLKGIGPAKAFGCGLLSIAKV